MHVPTLNLGDLFLPLWQGKFTCEHPDHVRNWDWAILKEIFGKCMGPRLVNAALTCQVVMTGHHRILHSKSRVGIKPRSGKVTYMDSYPHCSMVFCPTNTG